MALDAADARRARLLAALLLALLVLGGTSAVVQATTIPDFGSTLLAMVAALLVLAVAYVGSRTRRYRLSAGLAAAAPALACIAIGVRSPDDRVWYAFILIAVIVSSLFFSVRTAALVAAAIFAALCLLPIWVQELRSPARIMPLLALHGVLSPLLLVAAHHHSAVERESQRQVQRRDARLAAIERLEAFARSAAHVSHDMNNLITVIGAGVAYLDQQFVHGRSEAVGEINAAIERLSALSRGMMTSARSGIEHRREFDPAEVIDELAPLLKQLAGPAVDVVFSGARSAGRLCMDPLRLEQVLMNLVVNARDAMPNGGQIELRCGRAELNDTRPGTHVLIEVTDTGMGMTEHTLERIFEPFFTTKANGRGTGLGLAIVQEIITQSGGRVKVSSTPGRGSRFQVFLPER